MSAEYNYDAFSFELEPAEYARWRTAGPQLGAPAPDFELPDLLARHARLEDLRGRPVVLEFGSFTCPIFCGHAAAMEELAREHPEATFLVVYSREAHPGELIRAHASDESKRELALRMAFEESIAARIVLVDGLGGAVHRAYGGAWDPVFVIGPDGRVLVRRAWNRPDDVRAALLALRAGIEPVPVESTEMAPPPPRGPAGELLLRGGTRAVLDFYRSAPPESRARLEASESPAVRAALGGVAASAQS